MIDTKSNSIQDEFKKVTADILNANNRLLLNSDGSSMFPVLHAGDKLIVNKIDASAIVKGDIIVWTTHNKTIGHRVLSTRKSGNFISIQTRGDNCRNADQPPQANDVIGKVTGFIRNEKEQSLDSFYYRFFTFLILHFGLLVRPSIRIVYKATVAKNKATELFQKTVANLRLIIADSKLLVLKNGIIALFQGVLPFAIIYLLKRLIDDLTTIQTAATSQHIWHLEMLIAITGFVFLLNLILNSTGTYIREKLSQSIALSIYSLLHTKHSQLDYANLENPEQQDKIHRATVEAGFRPNKLVQACLTLVRSIAAGIIIVAMMFSIHWSIVVILTLGLLPGLIVRFRYSRKLYTLNKNNSQKERQAYYYSRVLTAIPFAKELRLFSIANVFSSRYTTLQTNINNDKNAIYRKQMWSEIISQTIAIILIFVSFGFVSLLALQGKITIGTVVLFFLVFQRGFVILKELFQSIASLYEDNIFFADFVSFLQFPNHPSSPDSVAVSPLKKGISFNDVSFQYPSSARLALKNISLHIPAGKTIALVGANGSGKTTLIKLLCGFYEPTQGSIFFDESKRTASNQAETRKGITAVFQDFALYNMTAAENIWLGNSEAPMDFAKIKNAGIQAGIDDSLEKLPKAYHNMIGNFFEKGEELSIGQWQKLAIARAFYRNSDILLMDEPSSALDAETESQLIESLRTLAQDKTVLIVSHRFSTIQWVDTIYVMDEGKLVESGNHSELMNLKGKYYTMYSLQNNKL